jgi:hypothetical protein
LLADRTVMLADNRPYNVTLGIYEPLIADDGGTLDFAAITTVGDRAIAGGRAVQGGRRIYYRDAGTRLPDGGSDPSWLVAYQDSIGEVSSLSARNATDVWAGAVYRPGQQPVMREHLTGWREVPTLDAGTCDRFMVFAILATPAGDVYAAGACGSPPKTPAVFHTKVP